MTRETCPDLPLVTAVDEAVSRVEEGDVVHVLDVALCEMGIHAELVAEKVQGVECLGLRLRDGRDLGIARQLPEADEVAARVLQADALRGCLRGRVVEHQRSWAELLLGVLLEAAPANQFLYEGCQAGRSAPLPHERRQWA